MSDLENLQKKYGPEIQKMLRTAALQNALSFLNLRKLEYIANLSDDDIKDHAQTILADLRGHLKHEYDLVNIHRMKEFKMTEEPPGEYVSPEREAEEQRLIEK